jgi:hypothetical protein
MKHFNTISQQRLIKQINNSLIGLFLIQLTPSCSSTYYGASSSGIYEIKIDSYGNDNLIKDKTYVLLSGDPEISDYNLQFLEFADYVHKTLFLKNYDSVTDPSKAKLAILFTFGISDSIVFQQIRTIPIWTKTDVSSYTNTGANSISLG